MRRRKHGENWREVDVAKEEVEREEAQGDQVLAEEKLSIVLGHTVIYDLMKKPRVISFCVEYGSFQDNLVFGAVPYLEWTPSSNILEDVIKVLDNFFLFVFHD